VESLQHDGLTKTLVKNTLYDYIYKPVQKDFLARRDAIIIKNAMICGFTHKSFFYKGVLYSCDTTAPSRPWNKLCQQLREQMDEYLQDLDELNKKELPYVLGYITQILNASNHFGDYLRLFPDCLHSPLTKLIASCPCHTDVLDESQIQQLTMQNQESIALIRRRMMSNLLI
jgi:hypothetical protein